MMKHRMFDVLLMVALLVGASQASAFPDRPLRFLVPFPPGGTTDVVARVIAPKVGEILKANVVIDNRGGAGGSIATEMVAKSRPDGHTLLMATNSHTVNPSIYKDLPFDTARDFASVALVADTAGLFAAHPSVAANNLKAFVELARKSNPPLAFGSAGAGTYPHLAFELFMEMAKIKMLHIPYKGAAPALTDLLAGQYAFKVEGVVTGLPHVRAGRLKTFGVTSRERLAQLADVPTIAEQGYPDYESTFWMAILVPSGTPKEIVAKLEQAFIAAAQSREVSDRLESMSTRILAKPAVAVDELVKRELALWPAMVKRTGASSK